MITKEYLLENKCKTKGCWHYTAQGYIYCSCCLWGGCSSFTLEEKEMYALAKKGEK